MPGLDPAYVYPVQILTVPITPFALYVLHTHRGPSATLSPVHRELVANDRPDLLYVHFSHLHAVENTTGRAHCMNKFLPGDLLAVTRLGRLPNTTAENFVSSQEGALQLKKHNFWTVIEYALVKRTVTSHTISFCAFKQRGKYPYDLFVSERQGPINVPWKFYTAQRRLHPGKSYKALIFFPQAHPSTLLRTIMSGAARDYVLHVTSPLDFRHSCRPTLINATAASGEYNQFLEIANSLNGNSPAHFSNNVATDSLLLFGRLAISAALTLAHRETTFNHNIRSRVNRNYEKSRSDNAECWYCGFSGHFRRECRKKATDETRGIYRNRINEPFNAS
uniref:CCHC-type domain-containing protein n=1 Tax=Caenorhabditis japonica TaxID=281687 RepID=A0A8R1DI63_CAEJA